MGGIPDPVMSWQVIKKGYTAPRDLPDSSQELIIDSATLFDAGQYRCLAKNSKGETQRISGKYLCL